LARAKKVKIRRTSFLVTERDAPGAEDFWDLVEKGGWEWDTYLIFDEFLDKDHSYIDIGAWIGPTVLYGSQVARHCYAIEPDDVAFKILVENINLNSGLRSKITLFNGCIGDLSGDVKLGTMTDFGDSMSSISFVEPRNYLTVQSLTLDEFTQKNDIRDCNFVKMDIEGGESLVLPSMKTYLQKNSPTLFLSLHPYWFKDKERDSKQIMDVLKTYKHLYYVDGRHLEPNRLLSMLLSLDSGDFSIAATNKWNFGRRLLHVFRARTHHLVYNTLARVRILS
jgi:FkbM family methyltransferase